MAILKYNLIITTLMAISVLGAMALIYGYMDFTYAAVFFALLTSLGVFFAFNDLFLYYIIQPYDSAGASKSTPYTIINWVIYMIAFMNLMHGRMGIIPYTIVIVAVTALYVGIGTVLLLKFAPKRFRLR